MSTTPDASEGNSEEEMPSSKNVCTSCEQSNIDNITEDFNSVAILDNMSVCANRGKEDNSDNMNNCNKCEMVKYCNAACKKKHRSKHKKACDKLYDKKLFNVGPLREDCPICMLPLPFETHQAQFKVCCGKVICNGCIFAMVKSEGKMGLCPFCRSPMLEDEEKIKGIKKLMEAGNSIAFNILALAYDEGSMGTPQDYQKANKLWLKAGELGFTEAYIHLGNSYRIGRGVEVDMKKVRYYWEKAVINGDIPARQHCGVLELQTSKKDRAMKHFIIGAKGGCKECLKATKHPDMKGCITKDEYAITQTVFNDRQNDIKSVTRALARISSLPPEQRELDQWGQGF